MTAVLPSLAAEHRWVAWRPEDRKGKPTKVPYGRHGRRAETDNPATWLSQTEAEQRAQNLINGSGGGVGIVLGECGDVYLAGIDLDSCIDEHGALAPWAEQILAPFDTYTERSPSGTGIKIFFFIERDRVRPFLELIGVTDPKQWGIKRSIGPNGGDHSPGVEIYTSRRFFAITFEQWAGKPDRVEIIPWEVLEQLPALIPPPSSSAKNKASAGKADSGDTSRSKKAFCEGARLKREGKNFEEMCEALRNHPDAEIREWVQEKGETSNQRELRRIWERAGLDPDESARWRGAIAANQREALEYFNKRYFVLREPGKVWVAEYRLDATFESRREVLERFTFATFRELYLHRSIETGAVDKNGNSCWVNAAEWWLHNPQRRQFDGVVFDPSSVRRQSF
jgi:hypothetical protein